MIDLPAVLTVPCFQLNFIFNHLLIHSDSQGYFQPCFPIPPVLFEHRQPELAIIQLDIILKQLSCFLQESLTAVTATKAQLCDLALVGYHVSTLFLYI